MKSFTIKTPKGDRQIGGGAPCFIVAEVSANHNQKLDKAIAIVHAAAAAGADAVKFQTYTPDTLTIDCDKSAFIFEGDENPWKGSKLYDLYKIAYTPWDWLPQLKKEAEHVGLVFFSSVFDATAVDFMESIGVELYKIGSYEVQHLPLLKRVGETGKPVILSIGYASREEVELAVKTLRDNGCKDLAVLHCTTTYTADPDVSTMNLHNIKDIEKRFDVVAGFSENAGGVEGTVQAVLAGAAIVEKHVIDSRRESTPDADFSITPEELRELVQKIRSAEVALGKVHYGPANEREAYNMKHMRQSLFVVEDVKAAQAFTEKNLRVIRPGIGLPPKYMGEILGKRAKRDIERGTPMAWDFVLG